MAAMGVGIMTEDGRSNDLAALMLLVASGVDVLVDDAPRNWLAPARPAAAPQVPAETPSSGGAGFDPAHYSDVPALHEALKLDGGVALGAAGRPLLFASGDPASGLMLVGDFADEFDERDGRLFSGEAGVLLDRMLGAIGRDRSSAYFTNIACYRPAAGRVPEDAEGAACVALARRHIALSAPKLLILMGSAAIQALLGMTLNRARGKAHQIDAFGLTLFTLATYHPRQLLDQPRLKAGAWADLQLALEQLQA